MTVTMFYEPAAEERTSRSSPPPLRLQLAPPGSAPALIDGAWWPRSRDLTAELPALTAVLDPLWGRITRVTVNPTFWGVIPRKVPVQGHVVKVGWFKAEQDPHELLLLSYTAGRWDLLVIPPETDAVTAARLMTTATDPARELTASGLIQEAELFRIAVEAAAWDSTRERVWESEGGHDTGSTSLRGPAETATGRTRPLSRGPDDS
ncbi:DUF5994 family protein [Streptomyces sp. NPDC088124]|uniref:DUF5994 family protein n=1 Tax=Streptomyces sp. NPDC088124 TaxID=3154654 RepID=UPI003432A734